MKKKILKFLLTIVLLILILSTIFFIIDYTRVKQDKNPLFCIEQSAVLDGGTQIFVGLGYKVISFNSMIDLEDEPKMTYYTSKKIGPVFMQYDDFNIEKEKYKKLGNDIISYYKENAIDKNEIEKETLYNSATFYAEIKKINENSILVKGLEVNDLNHKSEFMISLSEYTKINHNGIEIKKEDLKIGNTISITYTGEVKEISPAVISKVYVISVLEDSESNSENNPTQQQKDRYNTVPNVTMEIKGGTLTPYGATVIITDKNAVPFTYGASFTLQKKVNNAWKEMEYLEGGGAFITIGYLINEEGTCEIESDWTNHYGKLESGEYRIIKEVSYPSQEDNISKDDVKYISTEFIIE